MQIGAKLPHSGPLPLEHGIPTLAARLEEAGFDSLWVSDHIVLPREIRARYPFAADGKATWATDTPYFDAMIALAFAAAVTERVRLGTAVLVLPLRHPIELAKQAASIDAATGGRLELGVGAGWLEDEFQALNVPFEDRGRRLVEWMELLRSCWTGTPEAHSSERYELPADTLCLPTPARSVPLLVGGHSKVALRRAGKVGDGWLAQQEAHALDPADIARCAEVIAEAAEGAERRITLRIVASLGHADVVAERLGDLADAGVDEVIVDVPHDVEGAAAALAELRAGAPA